MKKGRTILILYLITAIIALLGFRLYQIQVREHEIYSAAAFRQRSRMSELYHERGQILDRNMISFTGRSTEFVAVLQPALFTRDARTREMIAEALGVDPDEFANFSEFNPTPVIYPIDEETAQRWKESPVYGISVVERRKRTDKNMPAAHLIGYTNESSSLGLAGIEKAYQDILSSKNSVYALAVADAKNRFLNEYGYQMMKTSDGMPLSVKLTLDYHMQKLAEEVLDKMVVSGAVAVIDILSGDVLVLASRPGF